ncbi:MAG TPA: rhodanese-like domain-containing protein [Candidatus Nanoarchaeia archaeon]|nr:rhodanese-like domain-containing protein [Candidatus Nanoarchaeia archaeon]
MNKKFFIFPILTIFLARFISAHCPLCTIGAGAAGVGAMWLGVSKVVVALFIGGFAMSMGMWFSKIPKKRYIPFQKTAIVAIVFLTTIIPLMPLFKAIGPLYLSFIGEYGATYAVNYSLASSLFGGLLVFISPAISKKLTKARKGKTIPFQGTILTLLLLIILGILIQFSLTNLGGGAVIGAIEHLSPGEFEKVIQNGSVFLLNVHTPYQGQIDGTDEIIEDWENIEKYMDKLPKDTSVPIAVYCRSGRMSEAVAEELKAMGYQKIYDLGGGMNAWEESGRKII